MTAFLDLFSTSQTSSKKVKEKRQSKDRRIYDECLNNAPYFAYQINGGTWGIVQGCCNSWNCPRCGQQRAREEYGRIVHGAREIAKSHQLYFLTITCRGKEMSYETAIANYLGWTNNLLTKLRAKAKRSNQGWYYVCVTEHQKRQHPHSHFITTFCPDDTILVQKGEDKWFYTTCENFPAKHDTLQTYFLERACAESGLGVQYDLSRLESVEGGSRYAAKYLFKEDSFSSIWPKGWKRVRYSQSWPKLPDKTSQAFVLLSKFDWYRLSREALIVKTKDDGTAKVARTMLRDADTIVQ